MVSADLNFECTMVAVAVAIEGKEMRARLVVECREKVAHSGSFSSADMK